MKQLIISLGRQVGSGGHKIAEALAERFSLPLYDKNLIAELAAQRELDAIAFEKLLGEGRCESMKRRPGIPTFPGVSGASATPPRRDWPACSFSSCGKRRPKGTPLSS